MIEINEEQKNIDTIMETAFQCYECAVRNGDSEENARMRAALKPLKCEGCENLPWSLKERAL